MTARRPAPEPALRPVLVVGHRDSGKTAYARAMVERARAAGLLVAGVLSEAEAEEGRKSRYYARDVAPPGGRELLGSVDPGPGLDQRVGRFHMSGAAFASLNRQLMSSLDAELICLDEVGPLERDGGGFHPALEFLVRYYKGILLVTARPAVAPWLEALLTTRPRRREPVSLPPGLEPGRAAGGTIRITAGEPMTGEREW